MKRVILIDCDYDRVSQEGWVERRPAILVDDFTLMTKTSMTLDVYRSKAPINVADDGTVICRGMFAVEIELNAAGNVLDVQELASMSVAEFTKFMKIGW